MLEVGKTYKTFDGKRSFTIVGKKRRSTTGFFYIGECDKTGLIAYFNLQGHHAHQSAYWLNTDPYLYLPVALDGSMGIRKFVKREDLPPLEYFGYLKIDTRATNPLETVTFQKKLAAL